ncbi:MAG: GGDEF domain-containing protein [Oligoflexus sp.]
MSAWLQKAKAHIAHSQTNLAVDALYQCCDYIWREPAVERIIRRTKRVLREVFDLTSLEHYELSGRGTGVQLKRQSEAADTTTKWTNRVFEQIEMQMKLLNLGQEDYKSGLNYLRIGKEQFAFFLLGDSNSLWSLMIWQEVCSDHETIMELARQVKLRDQTLSFFIRQMQVMYRSQAKLQKAQSLLVRDDLTGLYNYRHLEASLENEIRRVQRFKSKFSVLFIDLDHFKPINDQYGHQAGSFVIKQVAEVLQEGLREVDSVFRYGGDEYVVLLLEANSETALRAAERIRQKIAETEFPIDDYHKVKLTASIGVASCPEHGSSKEELLRMADESMYRSKKSGKNRVLVVGEQPQHKKALADL